jgi:cell division protein FtsI/penicillin-binding protein 2
MFRWFPIIAVVVPSLASAQTLPGALTGAMGGRSGAAVVLSVESGKILASYRPQIVAQRVTRPGSAIKPFVLLELLRSGKVLPNTEWSCRRTVQIGSHSLDCQHVRTVEAMNAERALAYSCNSYFTEMGARLTDAELTASYRRAGFGSATHLVASEASGAFRAATTRELLQLKAVGEEGIEVTPLQMAAAYRRLGLEVRRNEGKMPSLLPAGSQRYDEALATVLAGLRSAVTYGTAQGARAKGFEVAGKTGTSTAEEGPWTHAWFSGFAPATKPEIVVVIFLERGHGSEAAEIAGEIFKAWGTRGRR